MAHKSINFKELDPIEKIALIFTIFGMAVFLLYFFILLFSFSKSPQDFMTSAGQMGDFVGGTVGTVFSLVGVLLLYNTFVLQRYQIDKAESQFLLQQMENKYQFSTQLKAQDEIFQIQQRFNLNERISTLIITLSNISTQNLSLISSEKKSFSGNAYFAQLIKIDSTKTKDYYSRKEYIYLLENADFLVYITEMYKALSLIKNITQNETMDNLKLHYASVNILFNISLLQPVLRALVETIEYTINKPTTTEKEKKIFNSTRFYFISVLALVDLFVIDPDGI